MLSNVIRRIWFEFVINHKENKILFLFTYKIAFIIIW